MESRKFFMITFSLALILAGFLGIASFAKGEAQACGLNQTATCAAGSGSITGSVTGALQSGGVITGIAALFMVAIGAFILIASLRSRE